LSHVTESSTICCFFILKADACVHQFKAPFVSNEEIYIYGDEVFQLSVPGFCFVLFFQFCEVGGLVIIHKSTWAKFGYRSERKLRNLGSL
jgi:hypothetical protein